jgi:hypothetical protein
MIEIIFSQLRKLKSFNRKVHKEGTKFAKKNKNFKTSRPQDLYYHSPGNSFVCAFVNKDHTSGNIIFLIAVKKDWF